METIEITGLDKLLADFARLQNPRLFSDTLIKAGLVIENEFKQYPSANRLSRASVYGSTFQSDRQRRFFFAAMRDGRIVVPYVRGSNPKSERLRQSWSTQLVDATTVSIGTNVSYARLIKDDAAQTRYAAAVGWRTIKADVAVAAPNVMRVITAGIDTALRV